MHRGSIKNQSAAIGQVIRRAKRHAADDGDVPSPIAVSKIEAGNFLGQVVNGPTASAHSVPKKSGVTAVPTVVYVRRGRVWLVSSTTGDLVGASVQAQGLSLCSAGEHIASEGEIEAFNGRAGSIPKNRDVVVAAKVPGERIDPKGVTSNATRISRLDGAACDGVGIVHWGRKALGPSRQRAVVTVEGP